MRPTTAQLQAAKLSGKRTQRDREQPDKPDWDSALEPAEAVVLLVREPSKNGDIALQHSTHTHTHTHTLLVSNTRCSE